MALRGLGKAFPIFNFFTAVSKYKTDFKLNLKPKSCKTAVSRSLFFLTFDKNIIL